MCQICAANPLSYQNSSAAGASEAVTSGIVSTSAQAPQPGGSGGNFWAFQGSTGNQNIDGLLSGSRWGGTTLTYSFPTVSTQYETSYSPDNEPLRGFGTAPEALKVATRYAMNLVSQYTNLVTTEVAPTTSADIRSGFSSAPFTAWAYYPANDKTGGDVWYSYQYSEYQNPIKGQYGWATVLHELGHALGLKHGHQLGGVSDTSMQTSFDQMAYSLMTYRSYVGASESGGYTNEQNGYAQTYMIYDIASLQTMYGANFNTNSGNTTYSWSPTTGEMFINGVGQGAPGGNRIFLTVWDGNGIDTYDFSNYSTNLSINLTPGSFSITSSTQLANLGDGRYAPGNVFNALQYNGDARSLIENANGGSGNDTIVGNSANNSLNGGGGNDWIFGGLGDDIIDAGAGVDIVDAGNGNDIVWLMSEDDTFYGADGHDIVDGGVGNDLMFGHQGADIIYGFSGNDTLVGDVGADDLHGQDGNDYIDGGADDDILWGEAGDDVIYGGSGVDRIDGGSGLDIVDSGDGSDLAWLIDGNDIFYGGNGDDIGDGGIGADVLHGHLGVDTLYGFSGDDFIFGGENGDNLYGQDGNDYIDGGIDGDILWGGAGDDRVYGGDGNDIVDGGDGVDLVWAGMGADAVYAQSSNDIVDGGAGDDQLYGQAGDDVLYGGDNNDQLYGDIGNDTLHGQEGNDAIAGGAGFDLIWGGNGTDTIDAGDDDDVVDGGDGNDTIELGNGNDTVYASVGSDIISGGAGNDLIYGQLGSDQLTGGLGLDRFVFDTLLGLTNIDVITDFVSGADSIQLSSGIFSTLSGSLLASQLTINSTGTATTTSHRIIYQSTTGALFYDADGTGVGGPVQFATLSTGLTLTTTDFLVV